MLALMLRDIAFASVQNLQKLSNDKKKRKKYEN